MGGVGSRLYGMMLFVLLAVFIAGLMIGRTRNIWVKKSRTRDETDCTGDSVPPTLVLMGAALAMITDAGRGKVTLARMVLAKCCTPCHPPLRRRQRLAGLSASSPFWNCLLAFCMFVGRLGSLPGDRDCRFAGE
ncbi:potassium-transporting ATPase subunit KdpA [Escherichia coli]